MSPSHVRLAVRCLLTYALLLPFASPADAGFRKIGELELRLSGLSATASPAKVTVPKNTVSGIRVAIRSGATELGAAEAARALGGTIAIEGELSGPGLRTPLHLPENPGAPNPDPFILTIPALPDAGDYALSNLRVTVDGSTVLDVAPQRVAVEVIEQVLITSVTTRPLTLDEIREKGIVLDSNSYLGFEFTLGLSLDSKVTEFTFPVVFDKRGVAVPQPILPASEPERASMPPLTTIVPMLLQPKDAGVEPPSVRLPNGETAEVRIPSVLVIPGNVGYLKQFFSAKLFVANGAPGASNLTVHDVIGRIKLPAGADRIPGNADDPLALPDTTDGPQPSSLPVLAAGADGQLGTADDIGTFSPGQQGQAEFLIRGEKEGFHTLDFDIDATLEGLVTGPVRVSGSGQGGVLVRNPYFDMTFTAPAVVRNGEQFTLFVTVNNISQSLANAVSVTLDASRMSGAHLVGDATQTIDTLAGRDSRTLQFRFQADRSGQLVATYLNFDTQNGTTGKLKFTLGVGERGVPLSPDTLVLPAATQFIPSDVLSAAMRVLGQAWSVSNSPSGTLPPGVTRTSKEVVTQKALALAEAGLRISLGQPETDAVRDLLFDFYGGSPVDPGFDQILRVTSAGSELARAIGNALSRTSEVRGGAASYEREAAQIAASGADFFSFAVGGVTGVPLTVRLTDSQGRVSATTESSPTFVGGDIPSAVIVPFGTDASASRMGAVPSPVAWPYTLEMTGAGNATVDVSVTIPNNGSFIHASVSGVTVSAGAKYSLVLDPRQALVLEIDADGDGTYETSTRMTTESMYAQGPRLVSATVIGPETLAGAAPYGFHAAALFDRVVDATSAANVRNYTLANNSVTAAKRQLSGRLVFLNLEQPEGPYVPVQLSLRDVRDGRNVTGPAATVTLQSRLAEIGAVVSGRVFNSDGSAVQNARITYEQNPELTCAPPLDDLAGLTAVRTDANGRYELRYVRQDACGMPFRIATADPNTGAVRSISSSVRVAGEQIVMDIALLGRGSVTGTVRSLSGAPVAGASVLAMSQTDPQSSGQAMTDSDGVYRIDNIVVGGVSVHAVLGASLGRTSGRIDRAGTAAVVDLTLDGGTVSATGVVRRVEGSSVTVVPGQQVVYYVRGGDGNFIPVALTATGADGAYAFSGMPTGEYRISAALNQRDSGMVDGIAAAGDTIRKDIAIVIGGQGYGTVRGFVKFADGTVASGVIVSVDDRGVLSEGDGSFELTGLAVKPADTQRILARSRDGLRAGQKSVLVSQPGQLITNVVVVLSGVGSAEFTVLDANRNPVVEQEVALLGNCGNPCGCAALKTDGNGRVRFDNIPLGSVTARATRTAATFFDQSEATATLQADGATAFAVMQFAGYGEVRGSVRNPDGSPALGATVSLQARVFSEDACGLVPGIAQRVRTDSAGNFRFTQVNVGAISVTATHPFYTTNVGAHGTLTKHGDSLDFSLRLVNTISGVLSGTVYLPDGVTPAGAGVEVTANGPLPDVTVMTDDAGHFAFARIFPEGTYNLTARDAITGGVRRDSIYLRASQDVTHDLRLKGRGTVNVRVVDGAGNPVTTSAFVRLQEAEYPNRMYEAALETANNGVAAFANVFEGALTATASDVFARGGRASSVLTGAGATLDMTVRMTTTGTVRGHFYQADGVTPIAFGAVRLMVNGYSAGQSTTNGSDDVGAFTFSYVPAGPVRIEALDPQTARSGISAGTITTEGEVLTLDVRAQGLGRVQGLVTSNGAAQPGAQVVIASGQYRASTIADAAGRYSVDGVPEGMVTAIASLSGNFLSGANSAVLNGEAAVLTLDVALRDSGRISGKVVAADGVTASPLAWVTATAGGTRQSTTTGVDGTFAFDRIPTGLASVDASVLGGVDKGAATTDVRSNETAAVTVRLNGVGSITGRTLDSTGQPISGDVTVTGGGAYPYTFTVQSQTDGSFALPQVLAGPFSAALRAKSGEFFLYGSAFSSVAAGETANVTVQVQPSGTVTGMVMRSDGTTPAVGANVTLQLDGNRGTVLIQAGTDGRFTARGVPLGSFTVNVSDPISTGLARSTGSLAANGETRDLGTIVVDDHPLTVLSITPADGATDVPIQTPVTLTFSNSLQSAAGISVLDGSRVLAATTVLSGDAKTVTLTGTWPDSKEITVSVSNAATDIFGRHPLSLTTSKFRTVDLSPPLVVAVAPTNGAIQVDWSSVISVTFNETLLTDDDQLSSVIALSNASGPVAGAVALSAPDTITFTPAAPLQSNATFIVKVNNAADASGNVQTVAFSSKFSTVDTEPPAVTISAPQPDAWIRAVRPSIQAQATDSVSGVDASTATMSVDGTTVAATYNGGTIYYTPSADLAQGSHTVVASAADRAGNRTSNSSSFRIDTVAPSTPVISGIAEGQVLRGQVTFAASSVDATSGLVTIELFDGGGRFATLTAPSFSTTYDTTLMGEGAHAFTARATDAAGNVSATSPAVNAVVDNRPLTVSFSAPPQNTTVRDAVSVTAVPSEAVTRIDFLAAGQTISDNTAPYEATFDLTSAGEGAQPVTATAFSLAGETAQATRTVVIDRTPPPTPDVNRITAEPPQNGSSLVFAYSGAVEPNATVELTNLTHPATARIRAASDGTFSVYIGAEVDDMLSIVAIDGVGNQSGPASVPVRSTPSLPPSSGSTSLRFDGVLVDKVSGTTLTADGNLDAVFTLSLSVGDSAVRTISYIDLSGPTATRSTRTGTTRLGVAHDAGAELLNRADGTINFPVTTGATLSLFATDGGFIQDGGTYTVTAVFTDGARFIDTCYVVPKDDRSLVAHSADVAAAPATVVVPAGGAGTTTITITNIRDIEGTLVPNGAKIAVSAADMASKDPLGGTIRSAGGAIIDGTPAPNNPSFRIFTISGGAVQATYSSSPVAPAVQTGTSAVIQVQAADASGNVLGTEAISTLDVLLRARADRAIVHVTPSTLYADKADRRAHLRVEVRDNAGNPAADGTKVIVSAASSVGIIGCCYLGSIGGTVIGGTPSPQSSAWRVFTVSGGAVEADFSSINMTAYVGEVKSSTITVVPADANGNRLSTEVLGTGAVFLVGAGRTEVSVSPETVPYVFPLPAPVQVDVRHAHDARSRLIPDGATLLVSAANSATVYGCCYVGSAGGTIVDGTVSPNASNMKFFPLLRNAFRATYSIQGVGTVNSGTVETATIQLAPGDPTGARIDNRNVGLAQVKILGPLHSLGSVSPSSIFGDGNLFTTTVRFEHILDTYGNPLPEGSKVVVTAANSQAVAGCCYVGSAGGQILNGDPSPTANWKTFSITDGVVDVTYGDQGLSPVPGQRLTANVVLAQSGANGERLSNMALGVVPVSIVGTSSAQASANPAAFYSDGADVRSTVTIANIRDLEGRPVPDGTLIGVTAANNATIAGCCYVGSAGGAIVGDRVATNNANFKIFSVANGQVVLQYSTQGMGGSASERVANVQVVAAASSGAILNNYALATVSIRILPQGTATVITSPVNVTAMAPDTTSQITITNLRSTDGSLLPDGSRVAISVKNNATLSGCCYVGSVGGTLTAAGTNPGDGTLATNNSNFQVFTIAGGQVKAMYSATGIGAAPGETKIASIQVVPADRDGNVLKTSVMGLATVRINGVTSTTAAGPQIMTAGETATVTFAGVKDAAGNAVPDGTPVAVTVANRATYTGCCWNDSIGGTIVNGTASPNASFKVFSVVNGAVSVDYTTTGAASQSGDVRFQVVPVQADGSPILSTTLNGGVWKMTVQAPLTGFCGEAQCVPNQGMYVSHFSAPGCGGTESYYLPYDGYAFTCRSWDGGGRCGVVHRTVTNYSARINGGACQDLWPSGNTLSDFVTIYR